MLIVCCVEGRIHDDERKKLFLLSLGKDSKILELGPSFNPLAPKTIFPGTEIVDHLPTEELIEKYKEHGVDTSKIEHVDYVYRGGSLYTLINKESYYDFILSSHVIEHTTNFIEHLQDCAKLLKKDGGVLRMAVPDKRGMFDLLREKTSLQGVINRYYDTNFTTVHSPRAVVDYHMKVCNLDDRIAWSREESTDAISDRLKFLGQKATRAQLQATLRRTFSDVHEWVFSPISFKLLCNDLKELGYIDLGVSKLVESPDYAHEFYVELTLGVDPLASDTRKSLYLENAFDMCPKCPSQACPPCPSQACPPCPSQAEDPKHQFVALLYTAVGIGIGAVAGIASVATISKRNAVAGSKDMFLAFCLLLPLAVLFLFHTIWVSAID